MAGIVNDEGRGYNLLIAFLAIVAGVVVIAQPKIGLVTVAIVGAVFLILVGIVEIAAGLSLRRLSKQM